VKGGPTRRGGRVMQGNLTLAGGYGRTKFSQTQTAFEEEDLKGVFSSRQLEEDGKDSTQLKREVRERTISWGGQITERGKLSRVTSS